MTEEIAQFYRMLELAPGASPEVVKQAYRELVKIWHPDRFPNDPKFQKRANEKTKEINEAYKKILAYQTGNWSESRLPRSGERKRCSSPSGSRRCKASTTISSARTSSNDGSQRRRRIAGICVAIRT